MNDMSWMRGQTCIIRFKNSQVHLEFLNLIIHECEFIFLILLPS